MNHSIFNSNQTDGDKKNTLKTLSLIQKYEELPAEHWDKIVLAMKFVDKVIVCSVISIIIGMATSIYFQDYPFFWFLVVVFYYVIKVCKKVSLSNIVRDILVEETSQVSNKNEKELDCLDNRQESQVRKIIQLHLKYKSQGKSLIKEVEKEVEKNSE